MQTDLRPPDDQGNLRWCVLFMTLCRLRRFLLAKPQANLRPMISEALNLRTTKGTVCPVAPLQQGTLGAGFSYGTVVRCRVES